MMKNKTPNAVLLSRTNRSHFKESYTPREKPFYHYSISDLAEYNSQGKLLFGGVYKEIILRIQNDRKWADSTCDAADRIMRDYIINPFQHLPFAEITEEDVLETWDNLQKKIKAPSTQARAAFLLRVFMMYAFALGYTKTTLWGLSHMFVPIQIDVPCKEYQEQSQERLLNLAKRQADFMLGVGRSVSTQTELEIFRRFLTDCREIGELIIGLIIWSVGFRPGEARTLRFHALQEKAPGLYVLVLGTSYDRDNNAVKLGGKSSNAPRIIPIPLFLAEFILHRMEFLRSKGFSDQEIEKMFICCPGTFYASKTPCSERETNRQVKAVYYSAGVENDMMQSAYECVQNHAVVMEHCEKSATAYLGRHQVATHLKGCGLPLELSVLYMGHAEVAGIYRKSDLTGADDLQSLQDQLNQRPIFQILNAIAKNAKADGQTLFRDGGLDNEVFDIQLEKLNLVSESKFMFREDSAHFKVTAPFSISFERETDVMISITPSDINAFPNFSLQGIDVLNYTQSEIFCDFAPTRINPDQTLALHAQDAVKKYLAAKRTFKEELRFDAPEFANCDDRFIVDETLPVPLELALETTENFSDRELDEPSVSEPEYAVEVTLGIELKDRKKPTRQEGPTPSESRSPATSFCPTSDPMEETDEYISFAFPESESDSSENSTLGFDSDYYESAPSVLPVSEETITAVPVSEYDIDPTDNIDVAPEPPLKPCDPVPKSTAPRLSAEVAMLSYAIPQHLVENTPVHTYGLDIYLVCERRLSKVDTEFFGLSSIGNIGVKIKGLRSHEQTRKILAHNPALPSYVIAPDSTLYRIPAGRSLVDYFQQEAAGDCLHALINGGFLVQSPNLESSKAALVCFTENGLFAAFYCDKINRKRKPVKLLSSETIKTVDACCVLDEDLLLVASNGKGLRINRSDFTPFKQPGRKPIQAMDLSHAQSHGICCLPYSERNNLLVISRSGMITRLSNPEGSLLMPHGRGTQGVSLMSVKANDSIVAAATESGTLLLSSNTGYLHCINTFALRPLKPNRKGLQCMNFHASAQNPAVIGCITLPTPIRE